MNIDTSNAHCGPRIQFPDHAWLRVVSVKAHCLRRVPRGRGVRAIGGRSPAFKSVVVRPPRRVRSADPSGRVARAEAAFSPPQRRLVRERKKRRLPEPRRSAGRLERDRGRERGESVFTSSGWRVVRNETEKGTNRSLAKRGRDVRRARKAFKAVAAAARRRARESQSFAELRGARVRSRTRR